MFQKTHQLGTVKLVQVQPNGLRYNTPSGRIYDPSRRIEVTRLEITAEGIAASTPDGGSLLDIHHQSHPESHYKPGNTVSIGFTSHYQAVRSRFGAHNMDGSAGENVIIECDHEIWFDDLGKHLLFENPASGQTALLDVNRFAAPCEPFAHFVTGSQPGQLPADQLKESLQFLGNGRRGFLLSLNQQSNNAFIQRGDLVYVVGSHAH